MRNLMIHALLLALVLGSPAAGASAPLKVGVLPYNSALALIKVHAPLRDHLSQSLGRPVEIATSPDFNRYFNDSINGRFDLLITAPHFGVMSIDRGYLPVRRYRATLEARLVVGRDSSLHSASDLRGKRIGVGSRLAIVTIGGMRWLQERGLESDRDYRIVEYPSHAAALAAVALADIDAAFVPGTMIPQTPADIRSQIRVMPTEIRLPHLMTLAHPRLDGKTVAALGKALDAFPATAAGKEYFANTGFGGYVPIQAEDIQALRPYVGLTRGMMGLAP